MTARGIPFKITVSIVIVIIDVFLGIFLRNADNMDRSEKRVLRRNTEKLANVIIPTLASNKLYTANIITRLDKDNIQVEPVAYKANSLLLRSLCKSHKENAFPELMKIIEDIDPHLAEAIISRSNLGHLDPRPLTIRLL